MFFCIGSPVTCNVVARLSGRMAIFDQCLSLFVSLFVCFVLFVCCANAQANLPASKSLRLATTRTHKQTHKHTSKQTNTHNKNMNEQQISNKHQPKTHTHLELPKNNQNAIKICNKN
jgi:hypothetical protein